jgi:hypothetical protein
MSMDNNPHRDRDDMVERMLDSARRVDGVPVRRSFVQYGSQDKPVAGPAHMMLRGHDENAFDLFLLHRAQASMEPWDVVRHGHLWAIALGLPTPKDDGATAVSRTWGRLAEKKYRLVSKERAGRLLRVTSLDESGSGDPYVYPKGGTGRGRYFKIPEAYWRDDERWYRTLTLRAKVMLMIALSLKPDFALPIDQVKAWYGVSPNSAQRGLNELREKGILTHREARRDSWDGPGGYVLENRYTLLAPFEVAVSAPGAASGRKAKGRKKSGAKKKSVAKKETSENKTTSDKKRKKSKNRG